MFTGAFAILLIVITGLVSLAVTAFWLWMLIECLTQETDEHHNRLIWSLVIAFTGVGAPIYFFTRRADRKRRERAGTPPPSSASPKRNHAATAAGATVVGEAAGWAAIVDSTHPIQNDRRLEEDRPSFEPKSVGYDGGYDAGGYDAGGSDGGF
ncbi:MAG: PLDc N-terminal domain-containing protein [Planctomycetota bacterium]